ncbi:contact-dependent growth inhibition system immunity protein [Massilia sp. BJB1822]|uniref:contact-dependent growth inhibition system immunity protein n=1 Tax=Massilia sp. BJB1822 TaxID=2744470 RepID=UPI0015935464|nr:contact-dependent growth inhibition system immunity protein [Massilia sp. BJB1822]NVE01903.1 CdiI family contact-dependent growth inhibition immunity protein [Massilia sp. BJB1822]
MFEPDAVLERIGQGLLEALDASRVLDSSEIRQFFDPANLKERYEDWVATLLHHTGELDRRKLFRTMKHCTVECESEVISIRPTDHQEGEGWAGQSDIRVVQISRHATAEEVGRAISLAVSRCNG